MSHRRKDYDRAAHPATGRLIPNSPSTEDVRKFLNDRAYHGWGEKVALRLGREARWVYEQRQSIHPVTLDIVSEASYEMTDANAVDLANLCWNHRGLIVSARPSAGDGSPLAAYLSALSEVADIQKLATELQDPNLSPEKRAAIKREVLEARNALDTLWGTL